jgi:hypothetical protein
VEENKSDQYKSIMTALNNLQVQSTVQQMNPMSAVPPLTAHLPLTRGGARNQVFTFAGTEKQKPKQGGAHALSIAIPEEVPVSIPDQQQQQAANSPGVLSALSLLAALGPQDQAKLLSLMSPSGNASSSLLQLPGQSAFDPSHLVPAADVVQHVDPYARTQPQGASGLSVPSPQPAARTRGGQAQEIPRSVAQMKEYERQVGFLGVFEELLQHESLIKTANNEIELYKLRFQKMCAQQQVLYEEYTTNQKKWASEKMQLSRTVSDLMDQKDRADQKVTVAAQQIKQLKRESGLGENEDSDTQTPDKYRYVCV